MAQKPRAPQLGQNPRPRARYRRMQMAPTLMIPSLVNQMLLTLYLLAPAEAKRFAPHGAKVKPSSAASMK